ncbi:MAG: EexN family lipoprotein [Pseudomonadota bacterium]
MRKTVLVLVTTLFVVAGCGKKEEPESVTFYENNDLLREDMIARCNADGGRLRGSPDCVNAGRASARVAARRDKEKQAAREAESERKLAAIRARQTQLRQEQQRLQQEADELQGDANTATADTPDSVRSFGAPTSAPMVNEPFQPNTSEPPVIGYEDDENGERVVSQQPPVPAQTVVAQPLVEPDPNVQETTQEQTQSNVAPQSEEWVVTPTQVQPSPAPVVQQPETPVRDPASISLDDMPGSDLSPAGMPTGPVDTVTEAVQEALEDKDQ